MTQLDYRQRQIESYEVMTKNMSTIIGTYKGYTTALVETLEQLSESNDAEYLKSNLKYMADKLQNLITENEERWNTRMSKKD